MSEVITEKARETVDEILKRFEDGFQMADILGVIDDAVGAAEVLADATNEEKREFAINVANAVIDETDTPWLPDFLADPLMKMFVPRLVDWAASKLE